jgi:hypothetical protein
VHQNHDYSYHKAGVQGVWHGEGTRRNFQLAGGFWNLHTIEDATHRLTKQSIQPRRIYRLAPLSRILRRAKEKIFHYIWHPILDVTRSTRHAMGLRQENLVPGRKRGKRHQFD